MIGGLRERGEGSFRHIKALGSRQALQLPGVIRVAGEEQDLVVLGEAWDGLDGGGAAGSEGGSGLLIL